MKEDIKVKNDDILVESKEDINVKDDDVNVKSNDDIEVKDDDIEVKSDDDINVKDDDIEVKSDDDILNERVRNSLIYKFISEHINYKRLVKGLYVNLTAKLIFSILFQIMMVILVKYGFSGFPTLHLIAGIVMVISFVLVMVDLSLSVSEFLQYEDRYDVRNFKFQNYLYILPTKVKEDSEIFTNLGKKGNNYVVNTDKGKYVVSKDDLKINYYEHKANLQVIVKRKEIDLSNKEFRVLVEELNKEFSESEVQEFIDALKANAYHTSLVIREWEDLDKDDDIVESDEHLLNQSNLFETKSEDDLVKSEDDIVVKNDDVEPTKIEDVNLDLNKAPDDLVITKASDLGKGNDDVLKESNEDVKLKDADIVKESNEDVKVKDDDIVKESNEDVKVKDDDVSNESKDDVKVKDDDVKPETTPKHFDPSNVGYKTLEYHFKDGEHNAED